MATKTVEIRVGTRQQVFPLGTVEQPFRFEIVRKNDGFVMSFVDTQSTGATFPLVPDGVYTAKVTKNGVSAEVDFNIDRTEEVFAVPDVINVTLV
jgi:hypothetical protein